MNWLVDVVNWILLTLGDAVQWLWHDGLGHIGSLLGSVNEVAGPVLAVLVTWINRPINAMAGAALAPIGGMRGWLSNTILAAITGVLLLIIYKYTSNQDAIGRVKDQIKANMLALKLFKDELPVVFRAQGRVLLGALQLLRYSLFPLLVMLVPVSLLLAQMGLWYQWRPLRPGESALITLKCSGEEYSAMPDVRMEPNPGLAVLLGPVHLLSKREVVWQVRAAEPGRHQIVFYVGPAQVQKDLVVGDGLQRISAQRPGQDWVAILLHPLEKPFHNDDVVSWISIDYPSRPSYTSGSDWWVVYFFVASMVFALIFKPFVNVKI
jgi:uncharacterized membrane protein (DUF106 family)